MRKRILLSGTWQFAADPDHCGEQDRWMENPPKDLMEIKVPHVWQNENEELFLYTGAAWYFLNFISDMPPEGYRAWLRFEAVDYSCFVWFNGTYLGRHDGGYLPFQFDVTGLEKKENNFLALKVIDPMDHSEIPIGKQGTWYTRVSGIWQDVYLEYRAPVSAQDFRLITNIETRTLSVGLTFTKPAIRAHLSWKIFPHPYDEKCIAQGDLDVSGDMASWEAELPAARLWCLEDPALYELHCTVSEGGFTDQVLEVFGLRKVEHRNGQIWLNGKPVYLRGALEQGFYPQTVYIAPSDEFIKKEIQMAKNMGFNMLRKHIKVELPRYLYWADRMGMLLWCEAPSYIKWSAQSRRIYEECLFGMIRRDFNHPSILIWSIFNEEWGLEWSLNVNDEMRSYLENLYDRLKEFDPTRIYCDNSGWAHVKTDLNDYHPYTALPDQEEFWHSYLHNLKPQENYVGGYCYRGEPNIISEFGMWGLPTLSNLAKDYGGNIPAWYDNRGAALKDPVHNQDFKVPSTGIENFKQYHLERIFGTFDEFALCTQKRMFRGIKCAIEEIRKAPKIGGYIITEFSDIEWEANGMLDYFRRPKYGFEQLKDFNGPLSVMLGTFPHNLLSENCLCTDAVICNDSRMDVFGTLSWRLLENGSLDTGCGKIAEITCGNRPLLVLKGVVKVNLPKVTAAGFYTLKLELTSPEGRLLAENQEELILYPAMHGPFLTGKAPSVFLHQLPEAFASRIQTRYTASGNIETADVVVTRALDGQVMERCFKGKSVVFLAEEGGELPWKGDFTLRHLKETTDWNRASSFNFINPALFKGIPLHRELGWETQSLMPDFVVPFSDYSKQGGRVVYMTGNREVAHSCQLLAGFAQAWLGQMGGTMLSLPYGKGTIWMTTFKLMKHYEKQPTGTWLLDRLIEMAAEEKRKG